MSGHREAPRVPLSRREFLALGTLLGGGAALTGCGFLEPSVKAPDGGGAQEISRLVSRPVATPAEPRRALARGLGTLATGGTRDVLLYVPAGYAPDRPAPLAIALHGAGQSAQTGIAPLQAQADAAGLLLVAPQSVGRTWDFIAGPYGVDVAALDRTLAQVFEMCAVDPRRIALTGFSDGASYALSLGITNGDLFTRIAAFSPGILAPAATRGKPPLFISHGTRDQVLNIDLCSRRFVPVLRDAGYDVTYREFDGSHTVPPDVAAEAAAFIVKG